MGEGQPVLLADGREAGKRFELREILDLAEAGLRERLLAEVEDLKPTRQKPKGGVDKEQQ